MKMALCNEPTADSKSLSQTGSGTRRSTVARSSRRHGAAAVEFAVCLPLLILLVFGSIEASSMIFLKQSLNVAAYEATREAIRRGKSNVDASARAASILDSRGTVDYRIEYPNGESFDVDRGEEVVTVVSAPSGANSPLVGQFIRSRILSARVVMIKQ